MDSFEDACNRAAEMAASVFDNGSAQAENLKELLSRAGLLTGQGRDAPVEAFRVAIKQQPPSSSGGDLHALYSKPRPSAAREWDGLITRLVGDGLATRT